MIRHYLTITLRTVLRHPLSAVINVSGLAAGIAVCILIMLFIREEVSFDDFHEHGDRIYRILRAQKSPGGGVDVDAYQPMPLIPALLDACPGIAHGVRFTTGSAIVRYGDHAFSEELMFTDPDVFSMFTFGFLAGDPSTALGQPDNIVLAASTARKYFGAENPIGKSLHVTIRGAESALHVTAVVDDLPENSTLTISFLASMTKNAMYERAHERWTSANGSAFIQLDTGVTPEEVTSRFPAFIATHFGPLIERGQADGSLSRDQDAYRMMLQPLRAIHLGTGISSSPERTSDPAYSWMLACLGLFVLVIACINFTTLSVGHSAGRAREVGMRKVLGAVRPRLMRQFWGEAYLLCGIAMLLGVALAEVMLPHFNAVIGRHLSFHVLSDGRFVAAGILLFLLVGFLAGSYPAWYISRLRPVDILRGKARLTGRSALTRGLVALQFGLSTILVTGSLVVSDQLSFMLNRNLGYDGSQVVVLQLFPGPGSPGDQLLDRLRQGLTSLPNVIDVSGTNGAFTHGYDINGFKHHGENRLAYMYRVDDHFLNTLGIRLVEGRNFHPGSPSDRKNAVLVNEALVREFSWQMPAVGSRLQGWNEEDVPGGPEVIGVVRDFNFSSLRDPIRPAVLFVDPDWGMEQALVKIAPGSVRETMDRIRSVWTAVAPEKPFEASFLDEDVQHQYRTEQRWQTILVMASAFAIGLACMGLFGLASLSVTRRTKEIGIRKVLGASVGSIALLLSGEFSRPVILANVVAMPLAYLGAREWLEAFAYRADIGPLTFITGAGCAFLVAVMTLAWRALRAGLANPVDALRYE